MTDPTILVSNLDIHIEIGNLLINVLYIDYEAPRPSWRYESHFHSSYELHLIPGGKGRLSVMGKDYALSAGSFYLTGPDIVHEQAADDTDPMSEYCINFEMGMSKKTLGKNEYPLKNEAAKLSEILSNTCFWFGSDGFDSLSLFEKLMQEIDNEAIGCITYIKTLATQIILNAIRCFTGNSKALYKVPTKNLNDSRRKLADNYFRDFQRNLSSRELAQMIGTSVRQLDRIMQDYYSMSFRSKLLSVRLEQVKKLLKTTSLPLWQISEKTGFTDPDAMARAFRKAFKVSPSGYRRSNSLPL